jgi:hypothetical protein
MPRYDATGPRGRGARTGWGRGPCGAGLRRGGGRGMGRGMGQGMGRGMGRGAWGVGPGTGFGPGVWDAGSGRSGALGPEGVSPLGPPADEVTALREQESSLKEALEAIQRRLAALEEPQR